MYHAPNSYEITGTENKNWLEPTTIRGHVVQCLRIDYLSVNEVSNCHLFTNKDFKLFLNLVEAQGKKVSYVRFIYLQRIRFAWSSYTK